MKIIILAGGGGTRLFPLSRTSFPKQFLRVGADESLLVQTIRRFSGLVPPEDILVVTNKDYRHHVAAELKACGAGNAHVLLEPAARNTAPAIALAARYCMDELHCGGGEVLFISPSDHLISPVARFGAYIQEGAAAARTGHVVTFGIEPAKPETGYGYIEAGERREIGLRVKSFKEKPDLQTAQTYLTKGNYYWNSGLFAFTINTLFAELQKHSPEIYAQSSSSFQETVRSFAEMPNISIDYAMAERSAQMIVLPMTLTWNDVGSWDALYEVLPKDETGTVQQGDCILIDCHDSLIIGRDRLIAGIGLEDTVVVETDDVIVVAKKGETQKVKDVVDKLKALQRKEAEEHTTTYRPWGSYTVLGEGSGYKMKRIAVEAGQRLSLQMHYHRSEHWIVTKGTAKVTIGEEEKMVHENESVFVPKSTKHRLENPGKMTLEIIEVQNGTYLEEDDIVRFEDIYGRS